MQKDMGKQGQFLRNSGKTWENIGKTLKKRKKLNTFVKNRTTKFNIGKTSGKHRENMGKHGKTWENTGKHGKTRENTFSITPFSMSSTLIKNFQKTLGFLSLDYVSGS